MAAHSSSHSLRPSPCFVTVMLLLVVILHVFPVPALSSTIVTHLPGFQGPLPFYLETGYVTVGEPDDDVELFYHFIKSSRNPKEDPLILWLVGGPLCASMSAIFFEIGPLLFKMELYNGSLPTIYSNPYSWIQAANFIFVDLPVNTGFSYEKSPLKSKPSDYPQIHHAVQFLRKWLKDRPEYLSNPFYIGGHSYIGITGSTIALEIDKENEMGVQPSINLQGYIFGNPRTNWTKERNARIEFSHRMTLISDEHYESLKRNCKGAYQTYQIDPSNTLCLKDVEYFHSCTAMLNPEDILEPECHLYGPRPPTHLFSHRSLGELTEHILNSKTPLTECPSYVYVLSEYWANDEGVRRSLGVRPGTIGEFIRCRDDPYIYQILDSTENFAKLSARGYRSLIYSGDHDFWIPSLSTQAWIRSLNYSIAEEWRPWSSEGQIAGYTRSYSNRMTFATVKGGKHTSPMNRPKETWSMFQRWINGQPL